MGKKLRYSVLRYSPSIISGEAINLEILFSADAEGYHSFWFTGNFQRIIRFDDTLDRNVLKDLLTGIQLEVCDLDMEGSFDLDSFIKFYINDFHFEKPRTILYENLDEAVDGLKKTYFRFDYRKEERPSKADDQKIIANWIRASGRDARKNAAVRGKYADQVRYDFATEDYLVKIFDFDGKDLARCINSAKAWAWNCDHEPKTVFVIYRYSGQDAGQDEKFAIIKGIFDDSKARFCSMQDGAALLQNAG